MDHCADTGAEVPAWLQAQVDAEEEAPLARCDEPTVEYEAIAGSKVRATWMFENVGEAAWPEEIYFRQIRGDDEGYEQKITGVAIEAGAQITISVDVDVPAHPGHHALLFRLAHGEDKAEFGDEVFLNLVSAAEDTTPQGETAAASGYFFGLAGVISRLTETNWYSTPGAEEADADNCSSASGPDELDISRSSWQVVTDDEAEDEAEEMATAPGPAGPAGEEEETESTDKVLVTEDEVEYEDEVEASVVADEIVDERIDNPYIDDIEEETEIDQEVDQNQPELTPAQREKQAELYAYNQRLIMSKYDRAYRDNLVTLKSMGFSDFD